MRHRLFLMHRSTTSRPLSARWGPMATDRSQPISRPPNAMRRTHGTVASTFCHVAAQYIGAEGAQLRDAALLGGLMIAAAGAAGLTPIGSPVVKHLQNESTSVF